MNALGAILSQASAVAAPAPAEYTDQNTSRLQRTVSILLNVVCPRHRKAVAASVLQPITRQRTSCSRKKQLVRLILKLARHQLFPCLKKHGMVCCKHDRFSSMRANLLCRQMFVSCTASSNKTMNNYIHMSNREFFGTSRMCPKQQQHNPKHNLATRSGVDIFANLALVHAKRTLQLAAARPHAVQTIVIDH